MLQKVRQWETKMQNGNEKQPHIHVGLNSVTERQRGYARKLRKAAKQTDISDYVRDATANSEQASIAGLLKWLDPGRHGHLTGEYEWYTPPLIIDAAREVLGGIDLDPASCEFANSIVKAKKYFTEEDDGLTKKWEGRLFINPPFAHPTVKYFADKLMEEFGAGNVSQAIWLSNSCVDVGWWQDLAAIGIVCFHRGRIKFYQEDGIGQAPTLGQTIIYLGEAREKFKSKFIDFGVVMTS